MTIVFVDDLFYTGVERRSNEVNGKTHRAIAERKLEIPSRQ